MKFLVVFILFFISLNSTAQHVHYQSLDSAECAKRLDSLRAKYGHNKIIPPEFELSILIALSYFPELDSTEITFKHAKISTTLNARPKIKSIFFNKRVNRKYVVRINSIRRDSVIKLKDVPFNARIGIFGHEFCHFVDYLDRGFWGLMNRLSCYANAKSKERYEKEIDAMTIAKGLGWQLHDWSEYAIHKSDATQEYKLFKEDIYLEPHEIINIIVSNNHPK